MRSRPAYIFGMGLTCALGENVDAVMASLRRERCALEPLRLFQVPQAFEPPVGTARVEPENTALPRTHRLARLAAAQALADANRPPDAIVLGTTTGGILTTETLLEQGIEDPPAYQRHAAGSVAADLALFTGCTGPVLTVSTACSSGAVAIKLALEMIRRGMAERVLTGGADSLSRLTCFGFNSLQLVDPKGARPLDSERRGMSVAEGAAMLLLSGESIAKDPLCILGAGLSCDAHHATAPHPEGDGALAAMLAALEDCALSPENIDYINLHGTGTIDNDLAEAKAVNRIFSSHRPALSSVKGATGHTLAAAGAIEAVISAACIREEMLPGNVGLQSVDPELNLLPVKQSEKRPVSTILSNSFGFGGNNAAVIIGRSGVAGPEQTDTILPPLTVVGHACLTGAGHTEETWQAFSSGKPCLGCLVDDLLARDLPPGTVRRLKRLPRMALRLAIQACRGLENGKMPSMVSLGTAWGALSETHDFIKRLMETEYRFPSPTDFVGSVHNAPAGQIAMMLKAKSANITVSGGDRSFEQALLSADLLTRQSLEPVLVIGADEYHDRFSPLFDPSVRSAGQPGDGGGALVLQRDPLHPGPKITLVDYRAADSSNLLDALIGKLGGIEAVKARYGALLVDLPSALRDKASQQLSQFIHRTGLQSPVIDYRPLIGEFGTASAVAVSLAVEMVKAQRIPEVFNHDMPTTLGGKGVLALGLGDMISAIGILPS